MNLHGAIASYKLWAGVGRTELHCILRVRSNYSSSQHVWYLNVWKDTWWRSRLFKSVKNSYFATVHCSDAPQIKLLSHLYTRSKNCEKRQLPSSRLPLRLSACPSKRPHETTRFSLDGYSQNLMRRFVENLSRKQLDATYFIIYSILIQCSTCFGR